MGVLTRGRGHAGAGACIKRPWERASLVESGAAVQLGFVGRQLLCGVAVVAIVP